MEGGLLFNMGTHLNALEKEALIKRYISNPSVNINDFCRINNVSKTAFRKWLIQYRDQGIEGLVTKRNGDETQMVLPDGIDVTQENLKREIMKLRIENERLKKNYTVQTTENGEKIFRRLKVKNLK